MSWLKSLIIVFRVGKNSISLELSFFNLINLNYNDLLSELTGNLEVFDFSSRYFIALSGPPASGKSTISSKLAIDLNHKGFNSSILEMDGFHFDDQILKDQNLLLRKGSLETFDVMGLLSFLQRLQKEDVVVIPTFDRELELSRSSAVVVPKETKVVIVEGNYVLLKSQPWKNLHQFFNKSIMIQCQEKILEQRLIERWTNFKLSKQEINQKVYENDLPNGINVLKNSIAIDYNLEN